MHDLGVLGSPCMLHLVCPHCMARVDRVIALCTSLSIRGRKVRAP